MTNNDLLDRIKELLEQHGHAIAVLQERFHKHDAIYAKAITRLQERFDEYELWTKDVLALLKKMDSKE